MAESVIEGWQVEDALGSWALALAETKRRVDEGEDWRLREGHFARGEVCQCDICKARRLA